MATIRKIIERTDRRKPNSFSEETKLLWIAQLDGKIAQDVMLMGVEELQQFDYQYPEGLDVQPLVSFPHEDLYDLWLEAQIDARNGEWNRYQNTIELYNAAYSNFVGWFVNTYKPGQGCSCNGWVPQPGVPQYYITAYGLAVKAGYQGTLESWLGSLKGEKGDKGDPGAKLQIGKVTTLPAGSKATASIAGTVQEPVLDLGIPEAFQTYKAKAGFIYPLAADTVPEGFLLCDGAEYSRTEHIELFAAIGTTYGEGDGETTFNVPNLAPADGTCSYVIATGKDTAVSVQDIILGAQAIPLEVQYGGTGATDPTNARKNLEIYPVGSIYMSVLDTDPGQLFGGTWERLKDRFLLSAGDTYEAGATGGEANHTLTVKELPTHYHTVAFFEEAQAGSGNWAMQGGNYTQVNSDSHCASTYQTGSDQPHNNMPPYLAVYMWKRVA